MMVINGVLSRGRLSVEEVGLTDSRQIPGLLGPIVFAMILLGLAFSGHFSPKQFSQM